MTVPARTSPFPLFLSGAGWGHSSLEIKLYFAAQGNYAMQKRVGKESYVIGYLDINHFFSSMNVHWQWQDNSFRDYLNFYHPDQLNHAESEENFINSSEPIWKALNILPAGTVGEMAVSFSRTYSMEEVKALLSDYDLDITWYAISTGQEANPYYPEDRQSPLSAFRGAWGLPELSLNLLYRSSVTLQEEYLESMKFLMKNEQTAKRIYRGEPEALRVPERYEYIKANGINVYGVVVTGPVKELLKLKSLDVIHSPALGDLKTWNWFNRNFQGEMY